MIFILVTLNSVISRQIIQSFQTNLQIRDSTNTSKFTFRLYVHCKHEDLCTCANTSETVCIWEVCMYACEYMSVCVNGFERLPFFVRHIQTFVVKSTAQRPSSGVASANMCVGTARLCLYAHSSRHRDIPT